MDWTQLAVTWGPSIPIVLFLLKVHRDLVYKIVPHHLRILRKEVRRSERNAAQRHHEFMLALQAYEAAHARRAASASRRSRAKPPPRPDSVP